VDQCRIRFWKRDRQTPNDLSANSLGLFHTDGKPIIEADSTFMLNGLIGEGCLRVDGLPGGWRLQGISQNGDDLTNRLFTLDPGDVKSDIVVRVEVGEPPSRRIPPCT
jgi:hypothetical protein